MASRGWTFTLNGYTGEDVIRLTCKDMEETAKYLIIGEEIAPTTGEHHLQGYAYFSKPKTLQYVRDTISPRAHFEASRGSAKQNRAYCTKEGHYHEIGTCPEQGKRTDIEDIKEMTKRGDSLPKIMEAAHSYQSMRTAELLTKYVATPKPRDVKVMWFWGRTGTGKTHTAFEEAGEDTWISNKSLQWWDGYYGQKSVIIDDFREDYCPLHELLRILDKWPYRVMIKGGSTWLLATKIIVTCPYAPLDVYKTHHEDEDLKQLIRRISIVREFTKEVDEVILSSSTSGS